MFNKTSKPTRADAPKSAPVAAAEPARKAAPPLNMPMNAAPAASVTPSQRSVASMLAADLVIDGNIVGGGDLHLDGTVRGDVRVNRLTVGETGSIEGSVMADLIEVRGRIVGAINGKQIKLYGTAYVEGDITHEQLSIDVGAYFQGRCLQTRKVETLAPVEPTPMNAVNSDFSMPSLSAYDASALSDIKPTSY